MNSLLSSPSTRWLIILILFMGLITLGSIARLNFEKAHYVNQMPATISVTGSGEVVAVPDTGRFTFSVNAEGDDATTAQSVSAEAINTITTYLTEAGVAETDIKTISYNVYPRYRYEERICPLGSFCPPGEQVQDGFEASQMIEVKVRNTDEAGALISGVGERGATNISGLDFTIDDMDAVRDLARAKAIVDANEKAVVLAEQLGVRLVRLVNYYEEGGVYEPYAETRMFAMDAVAEAVVPKISVGEEKTSARVTLIFEVK